MGYYDVDTKKYPLLRGSDEIKEQRKIMEDALKKEEEIIAKIQKNHKRHKFVKVPPDHGVISWKTCSGCGYTIEDE